MTDIVLDNSFVFADIDISVSLLLYFYMLAARALSLAPREDWTLINLSRVFLAQDDVWSGVDGF